MRSSIARRPQNLLSRVPSESAVHTLRTMSAATGARGSRPFRRLTAPADSFQPRSAEKRYRPGNREFRLAAVLLDALFESSDERLRLGDFARIHDITTHC